MDRTAATSGDANASLTEGELRLVRQAILMVSSYHTPRVIVAGLRYGDLILERCEVLADEAGVRLVALPATANGHIDFAVEPIAR